MIVGIMIVGILTFSRIIIYCTGLQTWPANLAALEANLRREVANLDPAMIRRAIMEMRSRAHKCIANNGGHVEN